MRILKNLKRRTLLRDIALRSLFQFFFLVFFAYVVVFFLLDHIYEDNFQLSANATQSILETHIQHDWEDSLEKSPKLESEIYKLMKQGALRSVVLQSPDHKFYLPARPYRIQKTDLILQKNVSTKFQNLQVKWVFSRNELYIKKFNLLKYGIPISICILVLFISGDVFGLFFYYRKSLKHLVKGINHLSRGNYDYRISLTNQDDVNVIIGNINDLAQTFQHHEIEMQISNAKYKNLVENSSEIIFSMNDDGVIITMNRAITRHLGYISSNLKGKSFESILDFNRDRHDDLQIAFFRDKLLELKESGKSQTFQIKLNHINGDVVDMKLRLEYMAIDSLMVFLGKMEPVTESLTETYCDYEHRKFQFGNNFIVANLVVDEVTRNLKRYFSESESMGIKIGVKEMIVNAIEHGNLEITYQEKTRATAEENYVQLIWERKKKDTYKDRKITILYSLNVRRVMYLVRDEGQGFDHKKISSQYKDDIQKYHGRGIKITRSCFDKMVYNDKGNEVRMIKYTHR